MNTDTLRILDVNLNRAREALRVMEDHARFALDDADAAGALKSCRHEIQQIAAALGPRELLAARHIVGDVGREVKTASELARSAPDAVVQAACARLSEAARSLGEYAKLISPEAARRAETLRYEAYEIEQRVVLRGGRRQQFRAGRVYVLLTDELCRHDWQQTAEAVVRGGAGCIQLREKGLGDRELLRRARWLRDLTREHGVLLAINDRPDLARLARADMLHVGQDDVSVEEARRVAGAEILVGKSTHTPEQFDAARAEQPDYLAVGPMYASATKPQDHIAGLELARYARERTELPLVAIGGITVGNVGEVVSAGADVIAVCRAVIGVEDPAGAIGELVGRLADSSEIVS